MLDEKIDVGDTDEQETEIDLDAPAPEQSLEEEIKVEEVTEDSGQSADASEKSDEQSNVSESKDDGSDKQQGQGKELEEYSEGVKKRIAKLTKKMREAERQRDEALSFAERTKKEKEHLTSKVSQLATI